MRRHQLEHAIRTACQIIQHSEVIIVGSQAILGSYDESQLLAAATMSIEVDILPIADSERLAVGPLGSLDSRPRARSGTARGRGKSRHHHGRSSVVMALGCCSSPDLGSCPDSARNADALLRRLAGGCSLRG